MEKPKFEIPDCAKCMCFENESQCICPEVERFIRNYVIGNITTPLNPEQREYCISTADWCWEGVFKRDELEQLSDKELAENLLNAWYEYASQY